MIIFCPNCGKIPVKCILCKQAGAFKPDGGEVIPHKGRCVYEPCFVCETEFHEKFKTIKQKKQVKKVKKYRKKVGHN